MLRAIEAQHGLLVERADQLWSFSHLTFQEHFTVQWLTQLSPKQLASKIADQQWQERVKQLVQSQSSDKLLKLIKQAIDQSVSQDVKYQEFLTWGCQKAESINATYRSSALRAFYFALALALAVALTHTLDPELAKKLQKLREQLPQDLSKHNFESFKRWWRSNGQQWIQALRQSMIDHRKISRDWQFTEPQRQALQQDYHANKFLVELLKLEGAVSEEVRREIEDNLLLPIDRVEA